MSYRSQLCIAASFVLLSFNSALAQENKKPPVDPKKSVQRAEDEFRQFFKKPETAIEYWAAMKYEIRVGKFDRAAEDLKAFLAKKPTKEELLDLEEQEGISGFLKLLSIPQLRPDGEKLLAEVTQVVKERRRDPQRIQHFVRNLQTGAEEREYAIGELNKSGAVAVPYLIDAIRGSTNRSERGVILSTLMTLKPAVVPPLLAALDMDDASLKAEIIHVLARRRDRSAIPGLWYVWGSTRQPAPVRNLAGETLALLEGSSVDQLPEAKTALTREAERYYQHQVSFPTMTPVDVWEWKNNRLVSRAVSASQAEEFYGLRYAGQALDIDPTDKAAQVVFVSLALEKGEERSGLDQPLDKGAPGVKQLVRIVNPELLLAVLDRALSDHRVGVILGSIRALGELGEVRALRPSAYAEPALLRALNYPDRRVQLAAADAVLGIPNPEAFRLSARVVDVLRRAAAADGKPRVVIVAAERSQAEDLARAFEAAGYATKVEASGNDVLARLNQAADVDALVVRVEVGQRALPRNSGVGGAASSANQSVGPADPIRYAVPGTGLPNLLAQIRGDINFAYVPVILMGDVDSTGKVPPVLEAGLRNLAARYPHVAATQTTLHKESLQRLMQERLSEASGKPLTEAERKANAADAMLWLKRLAVNEVPGYDVRPAVPAILKNLLNPDLALFAIEATGHLSGPIAQRELARLVLSNADDKIKAAAALELAHQIQRDGLALSREVKEVEDLYSKTIDAKLKGNLALVLGSFRPDERQTGTRLREFRPAQRTPSRDK